MKRCPKCEVNVLNDRVTCPLCHSVLTFVKENESYQGFPKYNMPVERNPLFKKMVLFFGIISVIISVLINYLTFNEDNPSYWSSIVVSGVLLGLVIVLVTILSNLPITIRVLMPMIFVEALFLTIEVNIQKYWSVYYFVPFLVIGFLISLFVLHLSLKTKGKEMVFDLLVFDIISMIISFILLIHKIKVTWTYIILFSFSIIMLLVIFFFSGKSLKEEFEKKMHL